MKLKDLVKYVEKKNEYLADDIWHIATLASSILGNESDESSDAIKLLSDAAWLLSEIDSFVYRIKKS